MDRLLAIAGIIDLMNEKIGRTISWLALFMILVQFIVVVMRYIFGLGSIMIQESIVYMHALIFLIAAGYTLLHDGHVRVDIFYGAASIKRKALINFIGVLVFLWPVCLLIIIVSTKFITAAWAVREGSPEGSGIQAVYLLKTTIWIFAGLLMLQGYSLLVNSWAVMRGIKADYDHAAAVGGGGGETEGGGL
ncbi:MAG: TRAP transporter small permease subunit [Alphaproteobacteria bacterium]|nr:TRAP transporter small permease subunit [Alphaproteobacteria bacterium]